MTRVGILGIGFMGMIHYLSYQKSADAQVVALCEMDEKRLTGDWRDIKGNFGPRGKMMDLSGIETFTQMDEMFADPDIDVIDICLPPAFHADAAVKALESGKHVFCEKPMALEVADTERMTSAAETAGKILMIGHVLPLFPEYAFAYQAIRSGQYGRLLGGNFKRVISDPAWLPKYYEPDVIGGPMLDLHIHDAHYIRLIAGMPTAVDSVGRMRGEVVEYFHTQFHFDSDLVVTANSGVIHQQGRSFTHGYEIHLEQATIIFEFAVIDEQPCVLLPTTVLHADGTVRVPELPSGDPMVAFEAEMKEVAKAVKSGQPAEFLTADFAKDAIRICQMQTASVKSGTRQTL